MITAKDWMSKPVVTCKPETNIKEAAKLMAQNHIGCLVVVENEKPVGIITERDLLIKFIATDSDRDKIEVKDIMTPNVFTASMDTPLLDVSRIMKRHNCRRVLVVDNQGKAVGIITSRDLIDLVSV